MKLRVINRSGGTFFTNPENTKVVCDNGQMDVYVDGEYHKDVIHVTLEAEKTDNKEYFNLFAIPYELWTDDEVWKYVNQYREI